MPCWQQVKIETSIRLKDRTTLQQVLGDLKARLEGNVILCDGLSYRVEEDGAVSAEVSAFDEERAQSFLVDLKREYSLATLSKWAKAQKFNVRRVGNKLKARRWV